MPVVLEEAYDLDPQVALRPEPFGALCYHYGNRRLSFLTSPDMVTVVRALAEARSVADALRAAGVAERRWPSFLSALGSLEASDVIHAR
jgi:mycofactocin biosynthesis protein MftB